MSGKGNLELFAAGRKTKLVLGGKEKFGGGSKLWTGARSDRRS